MWAQIINVIIGIWVTASPEILNYQDSGADSNHIVGPVIVTFAMAACWEATRGLRKFNIPLALWLVAAPWVLEYKSFLPLINDMICGLLIFALSLIKGKIKNTYSISTQE